MMEKTENGREKTLPSTVCVTELTGNFVLVLLVVVEQFQKVFAESTEVFWTRAVLLDLSELNCF